MGLARMADRFIAIRSWSQVLGLKDGSSFTWI